MAGSHWRVCAAMFVYLKLLVSGERSERQDRDIHLHFAGLTTATTTGNVTEVHNIIQQRLHLTEQKEECPEVPEEASKPSASVNQDLPFFDALLDNVIEVTDIVLDDDEEAENTEEETGESKLDSLIAAYEAFEDVMDIHNFATLSNNTREATFTEARVTLAGKSFDFTPEDLAVAARVVDAHGSWKSAKTLCPPLPSQDEGNELQKGILNATETVILEKRTSQWSDKMEELKGKCGFFRDLIEDRWNKYGEKVLAFEQAHGKTWYSDFNGSEGNATPAFSYSQSTFKVLTTMGVTPRAFLTALSHRLPGADCLKKEEVCKLQYDPNLQSEHAPSEAEMHELQLASHKLLLDYKKVCQVSAMSMLFEEALKSLVTGGWLSLVTGGWRQPLWFRPMLCGDHHLWNTQEIVDAASDIKSKVEGRLDQADQADSILQTILFKGGVMNILKAGLSNIDFYGGLKQMIYNRFGDKVELVTSWYNWFTGWLAYGKYIWSAVGKVWRAFSAVSTLGISEATPSTSKILTYFVESSPWALKNAMVHYKESHQLPNCKKLAADESELSDV